MTVVSRVIDDILGLMQKQTLFR